MSHFFYKDRSFGVYITANGLMEKINKHCRKYGYSYSKLAQVAIAEKLEREEMKEEKELAQTGVKGKQASTLATPTPPPIPSTAPEVVAAHYPNSTAVNNDNGGMYVVE